MKDPKASKEDPVKEPENGHDISRRDFVKMSSAFALATLVGGGTLLQVGQVARAQQRRQADGRVHFYSPETPDMTEEMGAAYSALTGIPVDVTYGGTSVIFNKLIAEARRPNADLWYGAGGLIPFEVGRREGITEPYIPSEWKDLPVKSETGLKLRDDDWHWVAMEYFVIGLSYNTELLDESEVPRNYDDLLDPKWRGEFQMPNPASSGTATLFVMSQLLRLGESAGWDYLAQLVDQASAIPDSGAGPTRAVAAGNAKLALCFDFMPYQLAARGERVGFVLPEPSPILANPIALVKSGPNPELAEQFIDWMLAADGGQEILGKWSHLPMNPDAQGLERPTNLNDVLHAAQDLDIDWLVDNFDAIRDEWRNRFG